MILLWSFSDNFGNYSQAGCQLSLMII